MSSDFWRRVQDTFDEVVAAPPESRATVLERTCGNDPQLRYEVESLLEHDASATPDFLAGLQLRRDRQDGEMAEWARRLVGRRIGRYEIIRLIASGGMGSVFEAARKRPSRRVALKLLHSGVVSPSALARFRAEPELLARLQHPHIAQVYEAGVHTSDQGPIPYFAMELIHHARPLIEYANDNDLSIRQRVELFIKACHAIHHGHQKGIIHRDIKPSNILVGLDGEPKVIDFGVARSTDVDVAMTTQHTQTGDLIGTIQYMSPEQCEAGTTDIDTRTDVYSLGMVLYELLTGALPYDAGGTSIYHATEVIRFESPRRMSAVTPRLRGDLEWITLKALEKDRERRYASALELAQDLERYVAGEPISARPPSTAYRVGRYVQRRPWQAFALGASSLVLVLVATTYVVWQSRSEAVAARRYADIVAYGANLGAAEAALAEGDPAVATVRLDRARAILEERLDARTLPWEFRHLASRVDESLFTYGSAHYADFAISPDNQHIAALRTDGSFEIADISAVPGSADETLIVVDPPRTAEWQGIEIAWGSGGPLIAVSALELDSSNRDRYVSLWRIEDLHSIKEVGAWRLGSTSGAALAFHPTRPVLATTGRVERGCEGEILLWDLRNLDGDFDYERRVHSIKTPPENQVAFTWSTDGELLASAGLEDRVVYLWDVSEFPEKRSTPKIAELRAHTYHIRGLAFPPPCDGRNDAETGRILASASLDGSVRLWDLRDSSLKRAANPSGQPTRIGAFDVLRGHDAGAMCVSFDPWGRRLFVGDLNRTIHVWDVEHIDERADATPLRHRVNTLRGHEAHVDRIEALLDGRIVSIADDRQVKLWATEVEDVPVLRGHTSSVVGVKFDPAGNLLTLDGAGNLFEWDPTSLRRLRSWRVGTNARRMAIYDPAESYLRIALCRAFDSGDSPNVAAVSLMDDGEYDAIPLKSSERRHLFDCLTLSENGNRLIAAQRNPARIHVWTGEWSAGKIRQLDGDRVAAMTPLNAAASWIAVCTTWGGVRPAHLELHHLGTRAEVPVRLDDQLPDQSGGAWRLAVNADYTQLAVGTFQGPIVLFNIKRSGGRVSVRRQGILAGHSKEIAGLAFHPNEPRLVSSARHEPLKVWDLNTMTEVASLRGPAVQAECMVFDATGERLASGSIGGFGNDNVARIWETGRVWADAHQRAAMLQKRAAEMRLASEARRHFNTARHEITPAEVADRIKDDETLPANVRALAKPEIIAPYQFRPKPDNPATTATQPSARSARDHNRRP